MESTFGFMMCRLGNEKEDKVNPKIYRFRTLGKEYSLDDLKNNTITGVTNDKMNDPYDCRFYCDYERIIKYIKGKDYGLERLQKCSKDIKIQKMSIYELTEYIINHLEKSIERTFYTSCFTNDLKKEIMWANYADNASGYVIEYDFDEIKNKLKKIKENDQFDVGSFDKVNYNGEKIDFTEWVTNYIDNLLLFDRNNFLDILDIPVYINDYYLTTVDIAKKSLIKKVCAGYMKMSID